MAYCTRTKKTEKADEHTAKENIENRVTQVTSYVQYHLE